MVWRPRNPSHAIASVVFYAYWQSGEASNKMLKTWAKTLAEPAEALGLEPGIVLGSAVAGGDEGVLRPHEVVEFLPAASGGSVRLVLEPRAVRFESSNYAGWSSFKRFRDFFLTATGLAREHFELVGLSLDYVDQFVSSAESDNGMSLVSNEISGALPSDLISKGHLWHMHRGWFDRCEGRSVLLNQNMDLRQDDGGDGATYRSLWLYTKTEARRGDEQSVIEPTAELLDLLHRISKRTFSSALSDEAKKMVGIV